MEAHLRSLPLRYQRRRLPAGAPAGALSMEPSVQVLIARAEGIALGLGRDEVRSEHLLLALLWSERTPAAVALSALERSGASRSQVYSELERRGINVGGAPLPDCPRWEAAFPVPTKDFVLVTDGLKRAGRAYRYNRSGDQYLISLAERPAQRSA
jgi:Clp amino terminal domain, pathogenicity island component